MIDKENFAGIISIGSKVNPMASWAKKLLALRIIRMKIRGMMRPVFMPYHHLSMLAFILKE